MTTPATNDPDDRWRALQAGLALLASRPRACGELLTRLRAKGHPPDAIDHARRELTRLGLIDDRAFAEAWVRDRLRFRPRGPRALVAELTARGVDATVASEAVEAVLAAEGADEAMLCTQAADKWLRVHGARGGAGDPAQRARTERRLAGFLQRRGFNSADIRAAVRAIRRDATGQ